MAGPLSWQPNRKSRNGMRALSKVPREHRYPPWSTTPPIAEEPMEHLKLQTDAEPDALTKMRRVLRGMVLVVVERTGDAHDKMASMLEGTNDERLAALAQEALYSFTRLKAHYDKIDDEMRGMRKALEQIRTEHAAQERALVEAQKATKERDDIAAKYQELKKQVDPEKQQLEIMYAIDEATAKLKEENSAVRRELGQRQTEINDLKASKRRLREALDRLAGKD